MISSPIEELRVTDLVKIIKRRSIVILSVFLACAFLLILYTVFSPRVYESTTTILLEKQVPKISSIKEDVYPDEIPEKEYKDYYYSTQQSLLRSYALAERVFEKLDLAENPFFKGKEKPINKLLSMVDIKPVTRTRMMTITVTGKNPLMVTNIANAWVKEFILQDTEKRIKASREGVAFLQGQLSDTSVKLQEAETKLSDFAREHRTIVDKEGLIEQLKKQKKELQEEIFEASRMYNEKHPTIIALNSQLEIVSRKLDEESSAMGSVQDIVVEYKNLTRNVKTYRNIMDDLMKRQKELEVSRRLAVTNIRVVDPARVPTAPKTLPSKFKFFLLFASLLVGVVLSFYLEIIDSTLRTSEEVEFFVKLPFFGYIPLAGEGISEKEGCLISHAKPDSTLAEAFRNIKVALVFAAPEDVLIKSVIVTSSLPKEGKTFTACNLATVFANEGQSTLLIDADMRKGCLKDIFDVKSKKGLSDVLSGKSSLNDVIVPTSVPGLSLIPSGEHIYNPTDILNTDNFAKLFETIEAKFQKIVIDVPPVWNHSDFVFWESRGDSLILVIKDGATPLLTITEAKKKFTGKASIIGAVLNIAEIEKDLKYYLHYFDTISKGKVREGAKDLYSLCIRESKEFVKYVRSVISKFVSKR